MKIISFYLPQFHTIPENDKWWGEGFTEWVNVKKARPLFEGHEQPKVPLGANYYNLLDVEVMRRQAQIAKEHGVYGFCFYHYWFDGRMLLEKPVENYMKEKSIDFPYCICWANENWTNQWVEDKHTVLISQTYGGPKEWEQHYSYLRSFFLDKRYIKKDNKPLFIIYRPDLISKMSEMIETFNKCAVADGLEGICFVCQRPDSLLSGNASDISMFNYCIEYQPMVAFNSLNEKKQSLLWLRKIKRNLLMKAEKYLHITTAGLKLSNVKRDNVRTYDYDELWREIISLKRMSQNSIPGAFVNWDNTPRKGQRGSVVLGVTPEKFKQYLSQQISHTKSEYEQDMIFMFAWNEWAEGGYLEPDEINKFAYLNGIREALQENNEFPW